MRQAQKLLSKHKVTERAADGSIKKTAPIGEEWVPMNVETYRVDSKDEFYASLSTTRLSQLGWKTTRTIEVG